MSRCKLNESFANAVCGTAGISGVNGDIYFIPGETWDNAIISEDVNDSSGTFGTITGITLQGQGSKAVRYSLPGTSPVPSVEFVQNQGGNSGYKHTLQFFMPSVSPLWKHDINGLKNYGNVRALVVLSSDNVTGLYGRECGLVLTAYAETPADASNGGGAVVTLTTPPNGLENGPSAHFTAAAAGDKSSRVATLEALEALLTPVS